MYLLKHLHRSHGGVAEEQVRQSLPDKDQAISHYTTNHTINIQQYACYHKDECKH